MVDLSEIQAAYYMVAATGVLVAAGYYVLNMRATQRNMKANLETRQTQLFMDIWKVFSSKEYQKDREQMFYIWEFRDYEDFFKKYGPDVNPDEHAIFDMNCSYYEGIGVLVRRGVISPDLVYDLMYGSIIYFWEHFLPIFEGLRTRFASPIIFGDVEFLYNEMKRIRDSRGNATIKQTKPFMG
jgi:hypothetical protein